MHHDPVFPADPDAAAEPQAQPPRAAATLAHGVAEQLRERIIQGEFRPGARLNERALCEQLGVSRTPLREAFRLLAAEDLISLSPNRGAQVVALSEADIREAFEVIGGLEAMSCRLACQRATDAEIAEIRALTYEMLASHARHDLHAYYQANRAIHCLISRAAHNALLTRLYETQNLRIQNLRFVSNENRAKWDQAMHEHLAMAEALAARDGDRLADLMRVHLQRKCDAVLTALAASRGEHPDFRSTPTGCSPPSTASEESCHG